MRDHAPAHTNSLPRHATQQQSATERGRRRAVGAGIVLMCAATTLAPSSGLEYTVAPGDALWTIAASHDVQLDDLIATNGLADPDLIIAGTTLTIPDEPSAASPVSEPSPPSLPGHTVESGDTLWAIATRYGVPMGALARQNGVGDNGLIFPGQVLQLPVDGADAGARTAYHGAPAAITSAHTIESGDSLWSISHRYGVTMDELASANDLTRDSILSVGRVLELPAIDVSVLGDLSDLPADLQSSPDRLALLPVFDHWAAEYGVPADLLKALTWFESGWNNEKLSSASAIGIGQLLPITATFVSDILLAGEVLDPAVPEENIRLSARYLRYLLDNAGSVRLAVASYYQGLTATRQHGIYRSSEFYVDGILALRARFA